MAEYLDAIGVGETVERIWLAPIDEGDSAQSVTLVATDITASAELRGDEVVLTLSAGVAGKVASIAVTVNTSQNRVHKQVLSVPVLALSGSGQTVQDIVNFAMRKVKGFGETPDGEQAADALERLSDMLEEWRMTGADVSAPRPLSLNTVIPCKHSHISAIKNNLIVRLSDIYNEPVTPSVAVAAVRGLQLVKQSNLPKEQVEYF
jgi:hypothetical protein